MPAVQVTDLSVRYGRTGDIVAVHGIDLSAEPGEVVVILGPNGAGKTSTIESLEGYRRPSGGSLRVLGLDPVLDHRALTPRIGVMLQRGGVYPMLGPRQVLRLFASYYRDPLDPEQLLDLVSLRAVAATPWRHLSGGEQQRLSLALALIGQPEVVFLDEPTAGVDPEGRLAIRAVISDLRAQGVCVLVTTHELAEAERIADRIVILSAGRIALEGTVQSLTASVGTASMTFGAPAALDTSSLGSALGPGAIVSEFSPGRYRIEGVSGPTTTAALANWLAARQVSLSDLVSGRTLEDVYFGAVGVVGAQPVPESDQPSRRRRRNVQ